MARGGRGRGQWGGAPLLMLAVALIMLVALAGAVRRVPPAEETQRRLQEEEGGQGSTNKEWCMAAGFNPASLKCATCEKLANDVLVETDADKKEGGEELVAQCEQCCQEGGEAAKYARAVLECDDFFLKFLDAFKKFKASEQAAAWVADGTLVFESKPQVRPNLLLFAAGEEEPAETVSVASWTAESLLDFLQESIPPPSRTEKEEEGDKQGAAHEEL